MDKTKGREGEGGGTGGDRGGKGGAGHKVLDHTYPELSVAITTTLYFHPLHDGAEIVQ